MIDNDHFLVCPEKPRMKFAVIYHKYSIRTLQFKSLISKLFSYSTGFPICNDPLYNSTAFGSNKGKGGIIEKLQEEVEFYSYIIMPLLKKRGYRFCLYWSVVWSVHRKVVCDQ